MPSGIITAKPENASTGRIVASIGSNALRPTLKEVKEDRAGRPPASSVVPALPLAVITQSQGHRYGRLPLALPREKKGLIKSARQDRNSPRAAIRVHSFPLSRNFR